MQYFAEFFKAQIVHSFESLNMNEPLSGFKLGLPTPTLERLLKAIQRHRAVGPDGISEEFMRVEYV